MAEILVAPVDIDGILLLAVLSLGLLMSYPIVLLSQWRVLRKTFRRVGIWLLVGVIGWLIGIVISSSVVFPTDEWVRGRPMGPPLDTLQFTALAFFDPEPIDTPRLMAIGVIIGASVGILQWAYLRAQVEKSTLWIPASMVTWPASLYSGWLLGHVIPRHPIGAVAAIMVSLFMIAVLSAVSLNAIIRGSFFPGQETTGGSARRKAVSATLLIGAPLVLILFIIVQPHIPAIKDPNASWTYHFKNPGPGSCTGPSILMNDLRGQV